MDPITLGAATFGITYGVIRKGKKGSKKKSKKGKKHSTNYTTEDLITGQGQQALYTQVYDKVGSEYYISGAMRHFCDSGEGKYRAGRVEAVSFQDRRAFLSYIGCTTMSHSDAQIRMSVYFNKPEHDDRPESAIICKLKYVGTEKLEGAKSYVYDDKEGNKVLFDHTLVKDGLFGWEGVPDKLVMMFSENDLMSMASSVRKPGNQGSQYGTSYHPAPASLAIAQDIPLGTHVASTGHANAYEQDPGEFNRSFGKGGGVNLTKF